MEEALKPDGPRLLALHRETLELSTETVDLAEVEDWDRPTPCGAWSLQELVVHMIVENRGFAAAACGERSDRTVWYDHTVGSDLRAEYRRSAQDVVAAFNEPGVLRREFWLPRIDAIATFPARQAIGFHLLDYVVHRWDVGVSLGRYLDLGVDEVTAAIKIAHRDVPDGPRPGRTFPTDSRRRR